MSVAEKVLAGGDQRDSCVLTSIPGNGSVQLQHCEIFGGMDGLAMPLNIRLEDVEVRFAYNRGIFANGHFSLENFEVSKTAGATASSVLGGGYGGTTTSGATTCSLVLGAPMLGVPGTWAVWQFGSGGFW